MLPVKVDLLSFRPQHCHFQILICKERYFISANIKDLNQTLFTCKQDNSNWEVQAETYKSCKWKSHSGKLAQKRFSGAETCLSKIPYHTHFHILIIRGAEREERIDFSNFWRIYWQARDTYCLRTLVKYMGPCSTFSLLRCTTNQQIKSFLTDKVRIQVLPKYMSHSVSLLCRKKR